jgi:hypothetical protein
MNNNFKYDIKKRARIASGLTTLFQDDLNHIRADANDLDIICLEESVKDAKATLQMLIDNVTEIEYKLYLAKSRD